LGISRNNIVRGWSSISDVFSTIQGTHYWAARGQQIRWKEKHIVIICDNRGYYETIESKTLDEKEMIRRGEYLAKVL